MSLQNTVGTVSQAWCCAWSPIPDCSSQAHFSELTVTNGKCGTVTAGIPSSRERHASGRRIAGPPRVWADWRVHEAYRLCADRTRTELESSG